MSIEMSKQRKLHASFAWAVALVLITVVVHLVYVQTLVPPQVAWWNYYGWRVSEGDVLYKDLFCFLTPYYVLFMAALEHLFGSTLILYQVLGLVLRCVEVLLVYNLARRFASNLVSFLAALSGLWLTMCYLMDMPFDYNQELRLLVALIAYLCVKALEEEEKGRGQRWFFGAGLAMGVAFWIKQTGIAFIVAALFVFVLYFQFAKKNIRRLLRPLAFLALGMLVSSIPAIVYFVSTNSFGSFLACLQIAGSSKGSLKSLIARFFEYQIVWEEVLASILLCAGIVYVAVAKGNKKKWAVRIGLLAIVLLLVKRCNDVSFYGSLNSPLMNAALLCVVLVLAAAIFWLFERNNPVAGQLRQKAAAARQWLEDKVENTRWILPMGAVVVVAILTYVIFRYGYDARTQIYQQYHLTSEVRVLVNILSWSAIILALFQTVQIVRGGQDLLGGLGCYALAGFAACLLALGCVSSVFEELYMMPVATATLALFVSGGNKSYHWGRILLLVVLDLALLGTMITQKQLEPYTWHGWTSVGLERPDTEYEQMDGALAGYTLDSDTAEAYRTIIDLIEENSTPEDTVYQFPHIPLFNYITHRQTGTFAPIHYFDVCPDTIARRDAVTLRENPPKIVIWCEFGDSLWNFHEDYFRSGEESGQRDLRDFYRSYVQTHYEQAYQYDTISVWIRQDDGEEALFSGGSGTREDPYLLTSEEQLVRLSDQVNNGRSFENQYIYQEKDLDLQGYHLTPIGTEENPFMGTYDGGGHVIRNLTPVENDDGKAGLFGELSGYVYNLGLEDGRINGETCGAIAASSEGARSRVVNCYTNVTVRGQMAGGLVGDYNGNVWNSFSAGTLTGVDAAGALPTSQANDVLKVFEVEGTAETKLYTGDTIEQKVTRCSAETLNSSVVLEKLNSYVEDFNKQISDMAKDKNQTNVPPELVAWKLGTDNHPVYKTTR